MTLGIKYPHQTGMVALVLLIVGPAVCHAIENRLTAGPHGDTTVSIPATPALAAPLNAVLDQPMPPPHPCGAGERDATPAATEAELAALRAGLMIPVQGIAGAELPDTFAERRGIRRHSALDIPAPRGTPVLSAADGRLLKLFKSTNGGLMVYAADWTERFILLYAHLDRYAAGLTEGMPLRRGQLLGGVGTSGNAPPDVPHLHFAIARAGDIRHWWCGRSIDPRPLLVPEEPGGFCSDRCCGCIQPR
jgi:murein DD-endopeptidase MepM/ murein hydrolase activator NlpD